MNLAWWQKAIIYQVYPRSFQDMNGDGVGDLGGIRKRLPHLVQLGVTAVWLSPIFPSPMADFGYDISDYIDIDPLFGSLREFDDVLADAHRLGLKVILDLVPNHTSDQHPWFRLSRSSRLNPKRDWYIWRDPAPGGGPPNNWCSEFGGSAWQFDPTTGQFYYHAFLSAQPDLNWRNPHVRIAMHDVMRFWFRRGVDGFRIDALWHLLKDDQFRDNPKNPNFCPSDPPHRCVLPHHTTDLPDMQDVISGFRQVADEFPDRLLVGEIYLPFDRLVIYYGQKLNGIHLPFNFALLSAAWHAPALARLIRDYEAALPSGGWPNWVLGNHDRLRIATRIGHEQARIAAMLLLTLRGTPTIYYGDEIGMTQVAIPPDRIRDPFEKNVPGLGLGRDGARTPMPWNGGPNAGFSPVESWLPIGSDFATRNVSAQETDAGSMYNLYRRLIQYRQSSPALLAGSYRLVAAEGDLLTYIRETENSRVVVALNLGSQPVTLPMIEDLTNGQIAVSCFGDRDGDWVKGPIELRPNEGHVIRQ
jgi:alpha-glucosidase